MSALSVLSTEHARLRVLMVAVEDEGTMAPYMAVTGTGREAIIATPQATEQDEREILAPALGRGV